MSIFKEWSDNFLIPVFIILLLCVAFSFEAEAQEKTNTSQEKLEENKIEVKKPLAITVLMGGSSNFYESSSSKSEQSGFMLNLKLWIT